MPLRERQEIQEVLRCLSDWQVNPGPRLSGWLPSDYRISFRSKRTQSEKNRPTRGQQSRPVTLGYKNCIFLVLPPRFR
jgi:hypothetical protein